MKSGTFRAETTLPIHHKSKHLGTYIAAEEAAKTVDAARIFLVWLPLSLQKQLSIAWSVPVISFVIEFADIGCDALRVLVQAWSFRVQLLCCMQCYTVDGTMPHTVLHYMTLVLQARQHLQHWPMLVKCAKSQPEAAVNSRLYARACPDVWPRRLSTIVKAHRLLSTLFSFVAPAGLCFFLGLFMLAMNSLIVDADARISTGSKSSISKLTGSWPCTIRPKHMWDMWKQRAQMTCCTWKLLACTICKQLNHTSHNGNIVISGHNTQNCLMHCGRQQFLQAQLTKLTTMVLDILNVLIPTISLSHQQFWQPLLLPCTLQGVSASHVLVNVLGTSHSSAWRSSWTFNTMGCQDCYWSSSGKDAECTALKVLVPLILACCETTAVHSCQVRLIYCSRTCPDNHYKSMAHRWPVAFFRVFMRTDALYSPIVDADALISTAL